MSLELSDKFMCISDPEGYDINQLINNNKESNNRPSENNNLVILGDLLDSTLIGGNINDFLDKKSFNLRNIANFMNNDNIYAALGNRDLNKLKCLKLLMLDNEGNNNNNNKYWYKKYNNLSDMAYNLIDRTKPDKRGNYKGNSLWYVKSLTNKNGWAPVWNNKFKDKWNNESPESQNRCLDRFNIIFGADGAVGTMSAQNLLHTIPHELKQLNLINNNNYNDEFKAALVLCVFILLLSDCKDGEIMNLKINGKNLVGMLRNYYINDRTFVCYYIDKGLEGLKKLYLFSHGGMTSQFFDNDINKLLPNFKLNNGNISISNSTSVNGTSTGGKIIEKYKEYNIETIKYKIKTYNEEYKKLIKKVLNEYSSSETSSEELKILLTTAPYIYKQDEQNIYSAVLYSPVVPGFKNMRNNTINVINYKLCYNIYGHTPDGYSPIIDYVMKEDKIKGYNINCDISNTLIGNTFRANINNNNYSYLLFYLNQNKISNNTSISLNEQNEQLKELGKNLVSVVDYNLLELDDKLLQYLNENENFSYQGKFINNNNNNNSFYLFTELENKPPFEVKIKAFNTDNISGGSKKTKKKFKKVRTKKNKRGKNKKLSKRKKNKLTKRKKKYF